MRSVAIHVGVNTVDPLHYNGRPRALTGCENDARDMAAISRTNQFQNMILLTRQATTSRLLQLIANEATRMMAGDRLLVTFAGHGTRVRDSNSDEPDRFDEAWLLYDRILLDDELYHAFTRFRSGVRVIVVADSCYSDTSVRSQTGIAAFSSRSIPIDFSNDVLLTNKQHYQRAFSVTLSSTSSNLNCSLILLAACQATQVARDGVRNGLFTEKLKQVWAGGRFTGDYRSFMRRIRSAMPSYQIPCLGSWGYRAAEFERSQPFH
jgi:hypothetical protein